jgi:hypothetical protein
MDFETLYQESGDPWGFASNQYELMRYKHIYNALLNRRYNTIFEPGCSIGVLTEKLATLLSVT